MLNYPKSEAQVEVSSYAGALEKFEEIVKQLQQEPAQTMRHDEIEGLVELQGRELLRRLVQGHMDERSQRRASEPVIDAQGQVHPHKRMNTRGLMTIFGEVSVKRQGHGGIGIEGLHPLDAELNLPKELYSHTLSKRVAEAAAKESFDEVMAPRKGHFSRNDPAHRG